ncbi:MAG: extracellular solute-binding protein, partial [Erysipelotrichaceae bacterium]|nr:extracellular solute-binding protein [Erysipelotrichaceae bacterium]
MQKSFRTSVTLLAAAACLTGCMSKPAAPTTNESARVEPPADIWAPYEEEVTVTTMGEENSGTEFQGDDDYGNNPWYRAYKERFNINLVNKWISNDYGTKLNLAIADKDIADVFYVDSARLTTLYEAGLIMSLDEVFDSYASDVLKQYRK